VTEPLFPAASGATFSPCRGYRYRLWREWGEPSKRLAVIALNPSTAGETEDDPTIRKLIGFAKKWGFETLEMMNLFAWRSTDPHALSTPGLEPVGSDNDRTIVSVIARASRVVLAWGRHDFLRHILPSRAAHVRRLVLEHARGEVGTLGVNGDGSPRHPLYLPYTTPFVSLEAWRPAMEIK
jgi:hypothetical protein